MSKNSPTQRSLSMLRGEGWTCQITEKWNAFRESSPRLVRVLRHTSHMSSSWHTGGSDYDESEYEREAQEDSGRASRLNVD
jgi:hypothetical protein